MVDYSHRSLVQHLKLTVPSSVYAVVAYWRLKMLPTAVDHLYQVAGFYRGHSVPHNLDFGPVKSLHEPMLLLRGACEHPQAGRLHLLPLKIDVLYCPEAGGVARHSTQKDWNMRDGMVNLHRDCSDPLDDCMQFVICCPGELAWADDPYEAM